METVDDVFMTVLACLQGSPKDPSTFYASFGEPPETGRMSSRIAIVFFCASNQDKRGINELMVGRGAPGAGECASGPIMRWTVILAIIIALLVVGRGFLAPLAVALLVWNILNAFASAFGCMRIGGSPLPDWFAWTLAMLSFILVDAVVYWILTCQSAALIAAAPIYQMRGDFPMRYKDRLGEGGFRYLMEKGIHYKNAYFQHADTETPVGHTALFTGAYPAYNGIVAGNWFDIDKGKIIYNCEDDRYPMIGKEPKVGKGRAPTNILSSTIGDELVISNNGQSRVFSVSIKDRGAILPGGHTGKAFWYSKSEGSFVSSTCYYNEYPDWVKQWNAQKLADKYKDTSWKLMHDISTYVFGKDDDRPFEVDFYGLGTTFPHFVKGDSKYFYASLIATPFGDELTADFAKTLIRSKS